MQIVWVGGERGGRGDGGQRVKLNEEARSGEMGLSERRAHNFGTEKDKLHK